MAGFSLKATNNEEFSFSVYKNPSSGIQVKAFDKGHLFGWFGDNKTYHVYFQDALHDVSFAGNMDAEFEYLDHHRYNSPQVVLKGIDNLLRSSRDGTNPEHDIEDTYEFYMPAFRVSRTYYLDMLNKYYTDLDIKYTPLGGCESVVDLTVRATMKLSVFLHHISLIALLAALSNDRDEFFSVELSLATKYLKSLNISDAPYYVRQIFNVNLLNDRAIYDKCRELLCNSKRYTQLDIQWGNNMQARTKFVCEAIKTLGLKDINLIDIGSAEGTAVGKVANKISLGTLTLCEIQEELRDKLSNLHKFKNRDAVVVPTFYDIEEVHPGSIVTMTEVLEHLDYTEAVGLLGDVIAYPNVSKVLITMPNHAFNQHYDIQYENGLRHDDHKFELTREGLEAFIIEALKVSCTSASSSYMIYPVGDSVNNEPTCFGVLITKGN